MTPEQRAALIETTPDHENQIAVMGRALCAFDCPDADEGCKCQPLGMSGYEGPAISTKKALEAAGYSIVPTAELAARIRVAERAGAERMRTAAATLVRDQQIGHSSTGPYLAKRYDGNREGLAYADAIEALPLPGDPT